MIFKVQKNKKTTYISLCIRLQHLYKYNDKFLLKEFNDRIEEEYALYDIDRPQVNRYNQIYFTGISIKNEIVNCQELISEKRKLEIEEEKRIEEESNFLTSPISNNLDGSIDPLYLTYNNYPTVPTANHTISIRNNTTNTYQPFSMSYSAPTYSYDAGTDTIRIGRTTGTGSIRFPQ